MSRVYQSLGTPVTRRTLGPASLSLGRPRRRKGLGPAVSVPAPKDSSKLLVELEECRSALRQMDPVKADQIVERAANVLLAFFDQMPEDADPSGPTTNVLFQRLIDHLEDPSLSDDQINGTAATLMSRLKLAQQKLDHLKVSRLEREIDHLSTMSKNIRNKLMRDQVQSRQRSVSGSRRSV